jgi:uncharacterized membrane protein YjgN (DUF898 family)
VTVDTLQSPFDAPPPTGPATATPYEAPLVFTGTGAEYFRIWVVNAVLSIMTIGIYSAWAKVRKVSYFSRNTRLLGDCFEFTADPIAILRGRLIALALFGFYTFAFDFSLTLGLVATVMLLALAPLFFAGAMRFRLHNTRWRALRFAFTASRADAYRAVLIVIGLWLSASVAAALGSPVSVTIFATATFLLVPWMHHRLKAFQHRHVAFAGNASQFRGGVGQFYGTYVGAILIVMLCAFAGLSIGIPTAAWFGRLSSSGAIGVVIGGLLAALGDLAAWPYFAARIQRTVWDRTTLGPFSFKTTIAFRTLWPIALKNFALLAVTAGLYWPFASVAWARYRIGCMSIVGPQSPDAAVAALDASAAVSAVGEGAADFFGVDVGW